jgi:hypothetical protein
VAGFSPNTDTLSQSRKQQEHKAPLEPQYVPVDQIKENTAFIPEVTLSLPQLPSRGIAYPKDAWIKYRAYSFGEIKKVNQERLNEKQTLEFMLSGVECSFDKKDITLADGLYIGLLRKISTLGTPKMVVQYTCVKCASHEKHVRDTDFEFDDIKAPELPIKVDIKGQEYAFAPATLGKYFELCDEGKQKDDVALMAKQCTNHAYEDVYKMIYGLSVEDGIVMNEVDNYLYHGVKATQIQCSKCKFTQTIELDGGQALLIPFRVSEESAKSRIRFGNKTAHKPNPS